MRALNFLLASLCLITFQSGVYAEVSMNGKKQLRLENETPLADRRMTISQKESYELMNAIIDGLKIEDYAANATSCAEEGFTEFYFSEFNEKINGESAYENGGIVL